jgi:hypothetical protein
LCLFFVGFLYLFGLGGEKCFASFLDVRGRCCGVNCLQVGYLVSRDRDGGKEWCSGSCGYRSC